MRNARTPCFAALAMVGVALAGCHSPIVLGGEYRARPTGEAATEFPDRIKVVDEDRFTFLWGLFESKTIDVEGALARQLHGENERLDDIQVKMYETVAGHVIGWITFGILGHQQVEVSAKRVTLGESPASRDDGGS